MFVILSERMIARKNITAVFLLCCFAVMLGHNLVPHHHHLEPGFRIISHHCPSDIKDHSDDDAPLHCHAFNGSSFLKSDVIKLKQPLINESLMLIRDESAFSLQEFKEQEPCLIFKSPVKEPDLIRSFSKRGPPALA